jgi:hypothetical protein
MTGATHGDVARPVPSTEAYPRRGIREEVALENPVEWRGACVWSPHQVDGVEANDEVACCGHIAAAIEEPVETIGACA